MRCTITSIVESPSQRPRRRTTPSSVGVCQTLPKFPKFSQRLEHGSLTQPFYFRHVHRRTHSASSPGPLHTDKSTSNSPTQSSTSSHVVTVASSSAPQHRLTRVNPNTWRPGEGPSQFAFAFGNVGMSNTPYIASAVNSRTLGVSKRQTHWRNHVVQTNQVRLQDGQTAIAFIRMTLSSIEVVVQCTVEPSFPLQRPVPPQRQRASMSSNRLNIGNRSPSGGIQHVGSKMAVRASRARLGCRRHADKSVFVATSVPRGVVVQIHDPQTAHQNRQEGR